MITISLNDAIAISIGIGGLIFYGLLFYKLFFEKEKTENRKLFSSIKVERKKRGGRG